MISKKMYILVVLALLNACNASNNQQINPSGNILSSSSPIPSSSGNPENKPYTLSSQEIKQITDSTIVKANNNFGFDLFSSLVKDKENKDIFMSPASVALALQMAYNGADNLTKSEMAKTLGIDNLSTQEVNNLNRLLLQKLNNPASDITLQVANSLWGDEKRLTFKDEFINSLSSYKAQVNQANFSDIKTVDLINNWASQNTNGKIPKVITDISRNAVFYLINAIYFKADWTEKFSINETQNIDFTLANGSKKNIPMMSDFRDFRQFKKSYMDSDQNSKFQAAELTYGKDKKVSLFMFLPDADSSLKEFYSKLNSSNLETWLASFYNTEGYISFPKFKYKSDKDLKDQLINIGISQAFEDGPADFKKVGTLHLDGSIYLASVLHNTYIDVNEEGSEAAAVTTVVGSASASSYPTARFVADRPFFYLIRDNETKSILFMGAVNDPKYDE